MATLIPHILFIFGIQECTHQRLVADEYEHLSSKNRGPSDGPQNKLAINNFE
jgi:hypothetical protein